MDIQEKILKVINYSVGEGGIDTSSNEMVDAILSAVRQEIAEAIPREVESLYQVTEDNGNTTITSIREVFENISGSGGNVEKVYNQALSDIRSELKKRGIL